VPATLFDQDRDQLGRMMDLCLDSRPRAGLDPSNVAQDSFVDVGHGHNKRPSFVHAPFALARRRPG
jgi:hypothetical protein